MQCPIDQSTLAMTERQGIEIDYCPTCRGVWLDRGELDKLIDAGGDSPQSDYRTGERQPQYNERQSSKSDDRSYKDDRSYQYDKKRKKESFLGNLFDL